MCICIRYYPISRHYSKCNILKYTIHLPIHIIYKLINIILTFYYSITSTYVYNHYLI